MPITLLGGESLWLTFNLEFSKHAFSNGLGVEKLGFNNSSALNFVVIKSDLLLVRIHIILDATCRLKFSDCSIFKWGKWRI